MKVLLIKITKPNFTYDIDEDSYEAKITKEFSDWHDISENEYENLKEAVSLWNENEFNKTYNRYNSVFYALVEQSNLPLEKKELLSFWNAELQKNKEKEEGKKLAAEKRKAKLKEKEKAAKLDKEKEERKLLQELAKKYSEELQKI